MINNKPRFNLVLYIKTYRSDFDIFKNLLKSIFKHNKDNIPVYISVNNEDYVFFKKGLKDCLEKIVLLPDSDIGTTDIKDGWRYQQIIKSQFYKLDICHNYLCVDSDSEFIADFYLNDFLYLDDLPYTIMQESKPLLEVFERIKIDTSKNSFKNPLEVIRSVMGYSNNIKMWDYGPSPYLWSCKVWKSFYEVFLPKNNKSIEELFFEIETKGGHPAEALIYGEYLRNSKIIDLIPCECFFKVYHHKKQYQLERKYHNIEKLKKIYLGVIFQSNWKKRRKNLFRKLLK